MLKLTSIFNPTPMGIRNLSVINSSDFWQHPDAGRGNQLRVAELPAPRALAGRRMYSHTPQTKWYVMTPVDVTHRDRVKD